MGQEPGDKGTGSGRARYGKREVLTPLPPPPPPRVIEGKIIYKITRREMKIGSS